MSATFRTLRFLALVAGTAFVALHFPKEASAAGQFNGNPAYACKSVTPTVSQTSSSVYSYSAQWAFSLGYTDAGCTVTTPTWNTPLADDGSFTGSIGTYQDTGAPGKKWICGLGRGAKTTSATISLMNNNQCLEGWQISTRRTYTMLYQGRPLRSTDVLKVGDTITVSMNPFDNPGFYNGPAGGGVAVYNSYTSIGRYVSATISGTSSTYVDQSEPYSSKGNRLPIVFTKPLAGTTDYGLYGATQGGYSNPDFQLAVNNPHVIDTPDPSRPDVKRITLKSAGNLHVTISQADAQTWITNDYRYTTYGANGVQFLPPAYSGTSYASVADYAAGRTTSAFVAQTVSPSTAWRWNCTNAATCRDATQASFQTVKLNAATVADVTINVTNFGSNAAPGAPVVTCAANAVTSSDFPVSFISTDPEGDGVAYEIDTDYVSPTFVSTSLVPTAGYVASGTQQSLNIDLARAGTRKIAVRARDDKNAYSAVGTCTTVITQAPPPTYADLRFATSATSGVYTDGSVSYDLSLSKWGSGNTGVTVPVLFRGSSTDPSCVLRPYPKAAKGKNPNASFSSTWDSWPTLASPSSFQSLAGTQALTIKGIGTAPAEGTTFVLTFQAGCGTDAQTAAGNYVGAPDSQDVVIRITAAAAASTNPAVTLKVAVGSGSFVTSTSTSPYTYPTELPATGGASSGGVKVSWDAYNSDTCTFKRTAGNTQGAVTPAYDGTRSTTSMNGNEAVSISFSAAEVNPSFTVGFQMTCSRATKPDANATVFLKFNRDTFAPALITYAGRVFTDSDGQFGIFDGTDVALSGKTVTLSIDGYAGGPYTAAASSDAQGNYSITVPASAVTKEMTVSGVATVTMAQASIPAGTFFSSPPNGIFKSSVKEGRAYNVQFAMRTGTPAYSTIKGLVYRDLNNNGTRDAGEDPISGAQVKLTRTVTYPLPTAPTVTTLQTVITGNDGLYSLSAFVDVIPPAGATGMKLSATLLSLGTDWQFSKPVSGIATYDAVPGVTNIVDFGSVPPITYAGIAYVDANGNGLRDPAETPVSGATIQLYDKTTNSVVRQQVLPVTGAYSMTVPITSYGHQMELREPKASMSPPNTFCTNPAQDATATYCSYGSEYIGLYYGLTVNRDFGNAAAATDFVSIVSGRLYNDANGNGSYDTGDTPVGGGVVSIYDADNLLVPLATTPASDVLTGRYAFTVQRYSPEYNLLKGRRLVVKYVADAGYVVTNPSGGKYPPALFDGTVVLAGYDFTVASNGGVIVDPPGSPTDIFCVTD